MGSKGEEKPKHIFKPTEVQEALNGWLIHSHKGRDRHDLSARHFERKKNWLGVPAVILSAVVGTSVFASLVIPDSFWGKIAVGLLSIGAAVLSGLQIFHNYSERVEKHRSTGVKYKKLIREIEETLSEGDVIHERIEDIRRRLDDVEEGAAVVPKTIYDQVEPNYKQVTFIEKAAQL